MVPLGFLPLALFSLQAFAGSGFAGDVTGDTDEIIGTSKRVSISAEASFPASDIFGVKIVNGEPTQAQVTFINDEAFPITVSHIGGSLWDIKDGDRIVRNLTAARYDVEIQAGQKESLSYKFSTEMHPQDLRLQINSLISGNGALYNVYAYNGTVSVVEPETSIFDPQILFLYFFLLACFGGAVYFFYTAWVSPYFPQKRRSGKGEAKKSAPPEKADSSDGTPNMAASSATTYNAEWIPAHHISRPEQKRVRGRPSKARA